MIKSLNIKENFELIECKYYFFIFNIIMLFLCKEMIISNKLLIGIIAMNFVLLLRKKINNLEFLVWGVILPSEIYIILNIVIFCIKTLFDNIKKLNIFFDKILEDKKLLYFIGFLLVNNLVRVIINKNILSPLLSLAFLLCMLYVYISLKIENFTLKDFMKVFDLVIFAQFLILIFQAIYYKRLYPSDIFSGSLINAHMLGVWIGWYLIIRIVLLFRYKCTYDLIKIILAIGFMYLTDSKHIIIAIALGCILFGIVNILKFLKYKTLSAGIIILFGMYICTNFLTINTVENSMDKDGYIYKYIYNEPYNNKFEYFDTTLNKNLLSPKILFGYGSGVYGSRIANIRAHEYMAKDTGFAKVAARVIPGYVQGDYKEFAQKYDEKYLAEVSDMSAVLSYPFSSIISVFAELGLIGFGLLLAFWSEKEKYDKVIYGLLAVSMLCLMVFDSYFEMTQVAILFWCLMGVANEKDIVFNR